MGRKKIPPSYRPRWSMDPLVNRPWALSVA